MFRTMTFAVVFAMIFTACSKDQEITTTPTPDPRVKIEQDAAEEYTYANSLLNEVFVIAFKEAMKHPDIFGLDGEARTEDRGACPESKVVPGTSGSTLILDFGTGCELTNGIGPGPVVSGVITCISEGPYNTNANQYLDFDNVTINGYQIINNSAPGAPGLRFVNATPSQQPPYEYNFKGYIEPGTTFTIINPAGEQTVVELIEAPRSFACFGIVDNDPPLTPDFLDLLDSEFQIDIEKLRMTHYPAEGPIERYVISPVENKPLIMCLTCRFFKGGEIGIWGDLEQTIDYGWDPVLGSDPVEGDGCDGVAKIQSTIDAEDCRFVYCP